MAGVMVKEASTAANVVMAPMSPIEATAWTDNDRNPAVNRIGSEVHYGLIGLIGSHPIKVCACTGMLHAAMKARKRHAPETKITLPE